MQEQEMIPKKLTEVELLTKYKDYEVELKALQEDGYILTDDWSWDYDHSFAVIIEKGDEKKYFPLRECNYLVDEQNNIKEETIQVLDIRDTPWSKKLRM